MLHSLNLGLDGYLFYVLVSFVIVVFFHNFNRHSHSFYCRLNQLLPEIISFLTVFSVNRLLLPTNVILFSLPNKYFARAHLLSGNFKTI